MSIVWVVFVNSEGVDEPEKIVQTDCKCIWMVSCLELVLYEMKIHKRFNREVHDHNYILERKRWCQSGGVGDEQIGQRRRKIRHDMRLLKYFSNKIGALKNGFRWIRHRITTLNGIRIRFHQFSLKVAIELLEFCRDFSRVEFTWNIAPQSSPMFLWLALVLLHGLK